MGELTIKWLYEAEADGAAISIDETATHVQVTVEDGEEDNATIKIPRDVWDQITGRTIRNA